MRTSRAKVITSEETKAKISASHQGKPSVVPSRETRKKMSDSQRARIRTVEEMESFRTVTIERNKSRRGLPGKRGFKHTEESKLKMSLSSIGVHSGNKHPMFGKKRPDLSLRNKLNAGNFKGNKNPFFGKKHTEETKQKIRASKFKQKLYAS